MSPQRNGISMTVMLTPVLGYIVDNQRATPLRSAVLPRSLTAARSTVRAVALATIQSFLAETTAPPRRVRRPMECPRWRAGFPRHDHRLTALRLLTVVGSQPHVPGRDDGARSACRSPDHADRRHR